ncbi:unnamed protein product [Protopolystoma xenopodis]|uniref:Uncharacterized protein n=1 Tax=Protopolystoma xenopodis TaxID=117903 RepID=A0A3S4ZLB4_9PLAT|nr:unnamed protein product [Protopolystoma xenopodis]
MLLTQSLATTVALPKIRVPLVTAGTSASENSPSGTALKSSSGGRCVARPSATVFDTSESNQDSRVRDDEDRPTSSIQDPEQVDIKEVSAVSAHNDENDEDNNCGLSLVGDMDNELYRAEPDDSGDLAVNVQWDKKENIIDVPQSTTPAKQTHLKVITSRVSRAKGRSSQRLARRRKISGRKSKLEEIRDVVSPEIDKGSTFELCKEVIGSPSCNPDESVQSFRLYYDRDHRSKNPYFMK